MDWLERIAVYAMLGTAIGVAVYWRWRTDDAEWKARQALEVAREANAAGERLFSCWQQQSQLTALERERRVMGGCPSRN